MLPAAEQRDELASPDHSITSSSAATSSLSGTVRPSIPLDPSLNGARLTGLLGVYVKFLHRILIVRTVKRALPKGPEATRARVGSR